jgi:hypothetical protein
MSFKPGDLCVIEYWNMRPEWVGMEVIVSDVPPSPMVLNRLGVMELTPSDAICVTADWMPEPISGVWQTRAPWLRLKRPPSYPDQFTAGDWDLCPWQPHRERA